MEIWVSCSPFDSKGRGPTYTKSGAIICTTVSCKASYWELQGGSSERHSRRICSIYLFIQRFLGDVSLISKTNKKNHNYWMIFNGEKYYIFFTLIGKPKHPLRKKCDIPFSREHTLKDYCKLWNCHATRLCHQVKWSMR